VFGLDDRPMARRASTSSGPPGASTLTPPQVAKLYNFPAGSAAGQTIGILEFGGGYDLTDIDAFFSGLGQETPNIQAVSVDGVTNSPTEDSDQNYDGEVVMDIDVAGSVGVGANIAVYFAPLSDQGWADAVTAAVLEPAGLPEGWAAPSVLTCSWGFTELEADTPTDDSESPWPFEWTKQAIDHVSGTFQQAAMMGVTVFNCSFDNGSNEFQDDGYAHVAYPCSDSWLTACGGTLITNVSGSSFTENTWNDDARKIGNATGGGISDAIARPTWQKGVVPASVNPGGRIGRGLPDIAGNASYYSGYLFHVDGKADFQTNGTSSVAPLYAGLIAIINATLGHSVGYLNPTLYALAQNPAHADAIRDINDGISNAVRWTNDDETIGGPSRGYTSGPGWDACTGLGVLDGTKLLDALQNP
jgi:kumamolisin